MTRLVHGLLIALAFSSLVGPASGCESGGSGSDAGSSGTDGSSTDGSSTDESGADSGGTEGSSTGTSGTGTSSTDGSSTHQDSADTGTSPEDILACGLATPCGDEPIEASVTGAWTGDDYVEAYRCVLETLLQVAQEGANATPGLLRLGTNLYGDSPTNDELALGYADGAAMHFAHGHENGVGPWEDPHQRCALLQEAQYQACLDSPTIDCIGSGALFGACEDASPACP